MSSSNDPPQQGSLLRPVVVTNPTGREVSDLIVLTRIQASKGLFILTIRLSALYQLPQKQRLRHGPARQTSNRAQHRRHLQDLPFRPIWPGIKTQRGWQSKMPHTSHRSRSMAIPCVLARTRLNRQQTPRSVPELTRTLIPPLPPRPTTMSRSRRH